MRYSYNCPVCSKEVEVSVPMAEYNSENDYECPECKNKLTKENKIWEALGGINLSNIGYGHGDVIGDCR